MERTLNTSLHPYEVVLLGFVSGDLCLVALAAFSAIMANGANSCASRKLDCG